MWIYDCGITEKNDSKRANKKNDSKSCSKKVVKISYDKLKDKPDTLFLSF